MPNSGGGSSNNILYIFIHGVGSSKKAWDQYLKIFLNDDTSIKEVAMFDPLLKNQKCYHCYEYEAPSFTNPLKNNQLYKKYLNWKKGQKHPSETTIPQHADVFKTYLDSKKKFDKIYILAHSMGGLIALQTYVKLNTTVDKLVLFATPIAGSGDADDIKKFFNEKFFIRRTLFSYIVRELSTNSNTLTTLQRDIIANAESLLSKDIMFLYPKDDSRIVPASKDFANSFCGDVGSYDGDHSSIKEPNTINDISYILVKEFLNRSESGDNSTLSKDDKSIVKIKSHWSKGSEVTKKEWPFVVTNSNHVTTIYENNISIDYIRYSLEMMQDGIVKFEHGFRPFDKHVEEDIEKDAIFLNNSKGRFEGKSFKVRFIPNKTPIEARVYFDDGWFVIRFESEMIEIGEKFDVEISISDKVDMSDSKRATKRRDKYFEYQLHNDVSPHAIRERTYQIESYNDTDEPAIAYEPWLIVDGETQLNKDNCSQGIYYKSWKWKFYFEEANCKKMSILLKKQNNPGRLHSFCS